MAHIFQTSSNPKILRLDLPHLIYPYLKHYLESNACNRLMNLSKDQWCTGVQEHKLKHVKLFQMQTD